MEEHNITGEKRMKRQKTGEVMEIMTNLRKEWKMYYPEEEK